ncbi:MAG: sulfotransferase family 2 domain-containing protein [Chloroflexota bacterium]
MKNVIFHFHIFKNAGTTIDSIFEFNFPNQIISMEGKHPWSTLENNEVANLLEAKQNFQVITSHQARFPLPNIKGINFFPIFMLRHPLDRIGSIFEYTKRLPSENLNYPNRLAQNKGIKPFVEWHLENRAVMKNFQTIYLASREKDMRSAKATEQDLQTAVSRLRNPQNSWGVVEYFDESMLELQAKLKNHFGPLELKIVPQNVSQNRDQNLNVRLDNLRNNLGSELWGRLILENNFDLQLYNLAKEKFN